MIIKTSSENRQIVTKLTRQLGLGSENHIARIALAYSLENHDKLNLENIKNSGGKEYSKTVFFGENYAVYVGLICVKYDLHSSDANILKYIKLHLDAGLEKLHALINSNQNLNDLIKQEFYF